jgi:hypothetical protein
VTVWLPVTAVVVRLVPDREAKSELSDMVAKADFVVPSLIVAVTGKFVVVFSPTELGPPMEMPARVAEGEEVPESTIVTGCDQALVIPPEL